jgi:hypothetical protein
VATLTKQQAALNLVLTATQLAQKQLELTNATKRHEANKAAYIAAVQPAGQPPVTADDFWVLLKNGLYQHVQIVNGQLVIGGTSPVAYPPGTAT